MDEGRPDHKIDQETSVLYVGAVRRCRSRPASVRLRNAKDPQDQRDKSLDTLTLEIRDRREIGASGGRW